jgi:hypothetical protein
MPDNDKDINRRIRERAHQLWEPEGRPQGRSEHHWEQARMIVALEDTQDTMLLPVEPPGPEPIEAVTNQGEFPTLTDQGEEQPYPQPAAKTRRTAAALASKKTSDGKSTKQKEPRPTASRASAGRRTSRRSPPP